MSDGGQQVGMGKYNYNHQQKETDLFMCGILMLLLAAFDFISCLVIKPINSIAIEL